MAHLCKIRTIQIVCPTVLTSRNGNGSGRSVTHAIVLLFRMGPIFEYTSRMVQMHGAQENIFPILDLLYIQSCVVQWERVRWVGRLVQNKK